MRWLSKSICLTRLYELFGSVAQFFEQHDDSLCEDLCKSKMDTAYLTSRAPLLTDGCHNETLEIERTLYEEKISSRRTLPSMMAPESELYHDCLLASTG
ncbi:hypothetical protein M513_00931 [Trichuris suis]|uniref:Uncharacterized protein n=1 Tax=Trichuris suis TaxID=68888 RepID=A0A085MLS2_9BILA|nr:hypothetical protein M513_00931 [Trichuris suis]